MEGAVFFWFFWAVWVYATFLLEKKNPYRLKLAFIVLTVIIFSNHQFIFGRIEIAWSGLILLLFSYYFLANEKHQIIIYHSICSLIISIAYASFHLFEIFDPIWIIFKKEWMISICMWYLAILLQKNLKNRLIVAVSGTMQGEFLTAYILNKLQIPYAVGSFGYLDVCSLIAVLLISWSILENAGSFLQNYFPFLEKEKQKSS
ncbi:YphA family membrane protein [Neobacillus mesonae]|uniref:Uncharacterized protein n=1 Tax=Neobacillus mesonae TaxID=1193713 RepID=A0A3T0I1D6_9BACI|nr:hypothetical protein [Neobacillus mesonae]AZU63161.1 hypothetical protein CHR53_18910 [Neobacillus mesonae]MED4204227.1 hypothetical protein [Neobacillus mesonae]